VYLSHDQRPLIRADQIITIASQYMHRASSSTERKTISALPKHHYHCRVLSPRPLHPAALTRVWVYHYPCVPADTGGEFTPPSRRYNYSHQSD
jgi:hypothetical protein